MNVPATLALPLVLGHVSTGLRLEGHDLLRDDLPDHGGVPASLREYTIFGMSRQIRANSTIGGVSSALEIERYAAQNLAGSR